MDDEEEYYIREDWIEDVIKDRDDLEDDYPLDKYDYLRPEI